MCHFLLVHCISILEYKTSSYTKYILNTLPKPWAQILRKNYGESNTCEEGQLKGNEKLSQAWSLYGGSEWNLEESEIFVPSPSQSSSATCSVLQQAQGHLLTAGSLSLLHAVFSVASLCISACTKYNHRSWTVQELVQRGLLYQHPGFYLLHFCIFMERSYELQTHQHAKNLEISVVTPF